MLYQPTQADKETEVLVYNMSHIFDADGKLTDTIVTCWADKQKQWLVAPIWCFQPFEKRKLTEEK